MCETPQSEFTCVRAALAAAQAWRFPEGTCCVGRLQRFLKPPFAVSVQLTQLLLRESGEAETCLTLRVPLLAAVHLTELTDEWISDPVKRLHLKVGQLVKVRVLPPAAQPQGGSPQQWQAPPLQGTMRLSAFQDKSTGLKVCGRPERLDDVKVQHFGFTNSRGVTGQNGRYMGMHSSQLFRVSPYTCICASMCCRKVKSFQG